MLRSEGKGPGTTVLAPLEALQLLTGPRSVAVVGASESLQSWGGRALQFLIGHGFKGKVFPVNPKYETLHGLTCYPSVKSVPEPFDVVMVLVRNLHVLEVLKQARLRGCRAAVVISTSFAETGEEGRRLQEEVAAFCRQSGMRLMGPNCLGLVNLVDGVVLCTSTSLNREELVRGEVGMVSQSGAVMGTLFDLAQEQGLGFSYLFSVGNEADLQSTDYLEFLIEDGSTRVITMFLENVPDPERFFRLAMRAREREKPILVFKAGRSDLSRRVIATHTGAMAGDDRIDQALFDQAGVVRVEDPEDLVQTAYLLSRVRRFPEATRLGLISISGGLAGHFSDRCQDYGIRLPEVSPDTAGALGELLGIGPPYNPLDIGRQPVNDIPALLRGLDRFLNDPAFDVILFANLLYIVPGMTSITSSLYQTTDKPFVLLWMASRKAERDILDLRREGVPVFTSAHDCLKAIRHLFAYSAGRGKVRAVRELPTHRDPGLAAMLEEFRRSGHQVLNEAESKRVLARAGLPVTRERLVASVDEAVEAAWEIGYPVALKAVSGKLMHKTEAGAVRLNIGDDKELAREYLELCRRLRQARPDLALDGLLVQEMATPGYEAIVGCRVDARCGPVVICGHGGIYTELYQDNFLLLARFSGEQDIRENLERTRFSRVLQGFRGQRSGDAEALVELVRRFGDFALMYEEYIADVDLNPVIVGFQGEGVKVVDAVIRLKP